METFAQNFIGEGCMNCHNITAHISNHNDGTAPGNDFLWSLAVNAYPDVKGPQGRFNPSITTAFDALNALLRSAKSH
jgi:hypothetical protein